MALADADAAEEKPDPDVMSTYDKPPVDQDDVETPAQPPKESIYK